jgi:DNA-damage-inducible protein J
MGMVVNLRKRPLATWLQQGYIPSMSKTATVRARLEPSLKSEVEGILSQLGLTASETILLMYRQIKLRRGLPFEVAIPNRLTSKTLRESKDGKNVRRFATKREIYADLGL